MVPARRVRQQVEGATGHSDESQADTTARRRLATTLDLAPNRSSRGPERTASSPLSLADQAQEDVLSPDEAVAEEVRLFMGQQSTVGESLVHRSMVSPKQFGG